MKQSTIARRVLVALVREGWVITAAGGNRTEGQRPALTIGEALRELESVDCLSVEVERDGKESSVFFAWQGPDATYTEGAEIVADYGMRLNAIIQPILEAAI